jgi:F420-dependent methylenetetrahydromethanopterin dehydrogenase
LKETLTFTSEFLPEVTIAIVLSDNPNYENLKPLFDEYGYGFMIPNKDLIVIDGEQFINNFNADVLKFIEAHEIAHIILGHDGPRNEGEELEADLGAYILLKQKNRTGSIKELLKNFKTRHGIKFDEKLLEIVKNSFS